MKRRDILKTGLMPLASVLAYATSKSWASSSASAKATGLSPAVDFWSELAEELGDRLKPVEWPLETCVSKPHGSACKAFFESAGNPYFLGDRPGLTQTLGWVGAWTSAPSDMVVEAQDARDIAAAINFSRKRGVRLVVKGGGHSYKGTSNAGNSLLVWTRRMNAVVLHDEFVPAGSAEAPVPAVSVGAGAVWGEVYESVAVKGGRYVQGGGCLTVGMAGLVQSGGFGSFSKRYGLAAASVLEAEIVTADGAVRIVNAGRDPDLFFALKGGGGGTFGVVTRMTLATHDLPEKFGAVFLDVRASSTPAFRLLVGRMLDFYAAKLFNSHWGEQIRLRPDDTLSISMVFQGLSQTEAETAWAPFLDWVRSRPEEFRLLADVTILAVPARSFWDAAFLKTLPGVVLADTQPGAEKDRIFWASNREEAGQVIHAYRSAWLSAELIGEGRRGDLVDGLVAASRHWSISLHTNKGLAGATDAVCDATRDTAMNPAVINSFALVICAAEGPAAYPGVVGREPNLKTAERDAGRVSAAMAALSRQVPVTGAYLAESDYFEQDWQQAFWGDNYRRLLAAKQSYDPDRLFTCHHGVGST